jgi:ATP-dependent DNA helicase RecQ
MDQNSVLKQYFGHSAFRPGQKRIIDAILGGRDCLGVMPTGGGKSLCYQIPALLLPGLTVVVSPLISLMKDQVAALTEAGVPAAFVNSSLTGDEIRSIYSGAHRGAYKLLYVAPERLDAGGFAALAQDVPVSLVAVDEAHCISQWGQDFRPSYLRIADFAAALPVRPVVAAFTATATQEVRGDIVRLLGLRDPVLEITGFDRPNLYFDVLRPKKKPDKLLELVQARRDRSGIVYCATRAQVERVCQSLLAAGVAATRYHAGLDDAERRRNQDDFRFDRKTVMAATNAFGMGIDKSNVGFVIHYNMPKSLEAYYQEAGRAGRDGEPADCILLYSAGDIATAKFLIENSGGNEELSGQEQAAVRARDLQRLDAMIGYCKTTGCLRGYILDYFGQEHAETCGNCGNCRGDYRQEDVTVPAQMILSCVMRVREKLGYYVGKTLVAQVLRGSRDSRVLALGLDGLSTYGLMKNLPQGLVYDYMDFLTQADCLRLNPEHATLEPGARAADVLFHGEKLSMQTRADREPEQTKDRRRKKAAASPAAPADGGLLAALKAVRTRLAQAENVPAYIVFSNAALADMAAKAPRTESEFLEVSGVGRVKAARYGGEFLRAVAEYEERQR